MNLLTEQTLAFHPRVGDQLALRTNITIDGRPHITYQYSDDIVIAVNAALATGRPLLLRGSPGSGKSTLARDIALALDRDYDDEVVTSKTTASDLVWRFDAVGRLGDASIDKDRAKDRDNYIRPGLLWNAFCPGAKPSVPVPLVPTRGVVILIDEIDKADPDVPNDLLVILGDSRFTVTDYDPPWRSPKPMRKVLVLITTNGERELPPAFLRRCVALELVDPSDIPDKDQAGETILHRIARIHLDAMFKLRRIENPNAPAAVPTLDANLVNRLVARAKDLTTKLTPAILPSTRRPGTAELLDAMKACIDLNLTSEDDDWKTLTRVLLYKEPGNPDRPVTTATTAPTQ
jgi:MoxR-like ATPase